MTTPLVSLEDVKAHLPIRTGVTDYDARLSLLILTATSQIEDATEREFHEATRTQDFGTPQTASYDYDFGGTANESGLVQVARPANFTLKTVNIDPNTLSVYYDPSRAFGADTLVDPANYVLDAAKGFLSVRIPMTRTVAGLRVVHTGGYAAAGSPSSLSASIPVDLKMACIAQTLFLWARVDPMNIGRMAEKKEGEGANSFTSRGGLTPEAAALLVRYRAMRMSRD